MWEEPEQLGTHTEEVPRAPNPAGHKHMVRIGCCDTCLGRLGGKQRYDQSMVESGREIRAAVVERDPHLEGAQERVGLCPFCEDLFDEVDLLADLITEALEGREVARLQVGARFPKDQMEEEDVMRKRYGAGGSDPSSPRWLASWRTRSKRAWTTCASSLRIPRFSPSSTSRP